MVGNIRIVKKSVFELEEQFDVIMMHHSLEHILHPKETLERVSDILQPGQSPDPDARHGQL